MAFVPELIYNGTRLLIQGHSCAPSPVACLRLGWSGLSNSRNIALVRQVVTRPDRRDNLVERLPRFRCIVPPLMALKLPLECVVSEHVADPS
jgi:hypothetical protein